MSETTKTNDRCRGALLGLAVGDSLGAAVEFKSPGSFPLVTGYRGGGPHAIPAGAFTDDTSMGLALADSISRGWDLNDQAAQYIEWYRRGKYSVTGRCFDIGLTCGGALRQFEAGGDARKSGRADEQSSGNGSIMRLAPVAIRYHQLFADDPAAFAKLAEESSMVTHASDQCISACRYMAALMAAMINGASREQVLTPDWYRDKLAPKIADVAVGSYRTKQPPAIRGSGWVVQSLEAALWAFSKASSFKEAVLLAVNLGDDADTTGAVCGQLAGAYWGESGIDAELLAGLARRDMIEAALAGLGTGIL